MRTLVLMLLALAAFIWMWVMTHRQMRRASLEGGSLQVEPVVPPSTPQPRR